MVADYDGQVKAALGSLPRNARCTHSKPEICGWRLKRRTERLGTTTVFEQVYQSQMVIHPY